MDLKCWGKAHVEYWSDYITVLPCSTRWTPNLPICSIGHFNAHFPGVWCGICARPVRPAMRRVYGGSTWSIVTRSMTRTLRRSLLFVGVPWRCVTITAKDVEPAWITCRKGKCVPCKSDVVKELGHHYWVLITMDMCKALIVCDKCFICEICFCGL